MSDGMRLRGEVIKFRRGQVERGEQKSPLVFLNEGETRLNSRTLSPTGEKEQALFIYIFFLNIYLHIYLFFYLSFLSLFALSGSTTTTIITKPYYLKQQTFGL